MVVVTAACAWHVWSPLQALAPLHSDESQRGLGTRHSVGLPATLPPTSPALCPPFHRGGSLIGILHPTFRLSICFWRGQPATVRGRFGLSTESSGSCSELTAAGWGCMAYWGTIGRGKVRMVVLVPLSPLPLRPRSAPVLVSAALRGGMFPKQHWSLERGGKRGHITVIVI